LREGAGVLVDIDAQMIERFQAELRRQAAGGLVL
jgi:hypothetical protein